MSLPLGALMGWSVLEYTVSFLVFNLLTEEKRAGFFDCVLAVAWLLVFCVSFSWNHGGLFSDYGISWSYLLTVLVRVGIRPAIFHNSVKDSNQLTTALLLPCSVLCFFLMVPWWIGL